MPVQRLSREFVAVLNIQLSLIYICTSIIYGITIAVTPRNAFVICLTRLPSEGTHGRINSCYCSSMSITLDTAMPPTTGRSAPFTDEIAS